MNRIRIAAPAAFAAVLAVHAAVARAQAPGPFAVLDADAGVAVADDARALLVNPAALGAGRHPAEFAAAFARREDGGTRARALFAARDAGVFAVRDGAAARTYGAAAAFGSGTLRFGWAVAAIESSRPVEDRATDHRFGLLSRPAPWFSAGATLDHAFEPALGGARRMRVVTAGVGLRPLAFARARSAGAAARLTLSADVAVTRGEGAERAHASFAATFEPVPGLALAAAIADHRGVRIGVTLRGVRASVRADREGNAGGAMRSTTAVTVHAGDERTVFAGPAERRVAVVRAGGVLGDEALGGGLMSGGAGTVSSRPLRRQLERAAADPLTRGVLLDLRHVGGMAQLEELRPYVARVRAAGKPVVAYLEEGGGRGDLYLASACDRIVASEEAEFGALGLASERRYWKSALERVGVRLQRSSIGAYKSAYRNFSADSMPPADSVSAHDDLDTRQQLFVEAVAEGRAIPAARFAGLLDGRTWSADDLRGGGLVDSVGWREDALRVLGNLTGLGARPRTVDLRRHPAARVAWAAPAAIAIVRASGAIETGASGSDLLSGSTLGSATLVAQLERAFRAPAVRVVVLRIESPGGSALASNLIDHAVQRLRRETGKPLVVSMGSVAGSGGYYIACHADRIFADRHTRTGSIGVVTLQPSFEGLYAKLGARQERLAIGDRMGAASYARDWNEADQAASDSSIARSYRVFVAKVADGRHMDPAAVLAVAQGRVWFGEAARARGLVDAIGGLDDAVREARRLAGVPEGATIRPLEFGRPRGSFIERFVANRLFAALARGLRADAFAGAQAVDEDAIVPLAD